MNYRQFLSATLLSAALLSAPAASAETRSVAVPSADLNLASRSGQTAMQFRIARAIDQVCGSAHSRNTADAQAYATCSKSARAGATAQYDAMVAKAQSNTQFAAKTGK
ncbi:MAG TPA: UrcA family protein [Rhizomicrobium sp.]|nr:UrcA family protein [Rhizomicrobium sp.]